MKLNYAAYVGATLIFGLPTTASAQDDRDPNLLSSVFNNAPCNIGDLCVVDARGTAIGRFIGGSEVLRPFKGIFYNFTITPSGTAKVATFLYQSNNCSGTPYLATGDVFSPHSEFDVNNVLWAPDSNLVDLHYSSFQ